MLTKQLSLLKRLQPKTRYKILTCPTHEGYASMMGYIPHDFYMLTGQGLKNWDFHTRPLPSNHYMYLQPYNKITNDISFDLVLCQNRAQQFPILQNVADKLGLPIIGLNHTEPPPGIKPKQLEEIKKWRGDIEVFITEYNKQSWQGEPEDVVIPHGIDTNTFTGWNGMIPQGISIVNYFEQRDAFCGWKLWQKITEKIPVHLVGENPGRSQSIGNVDQLVHAINSYRFFLNTSQYSPIPLSLLEAAACGIPIVSTANQEVPKVFTHGENALLSNDPDKLIEYCQSFIDDYDKAKWFGGKARELIIAKYGISPFVERWNKVFKDTYNKVY